jgi:hypothetical protein
MITPHAAQLIAADRTAEMQRSAHTARLAALVRCCRPTAWVRATRRAIAAATRVREALRPDPSATCCA